MLSIFLTVVMLLTFVSCNKEYKREDNKSISTVNQLNQGDYATVISTHKDKSNLSPRDRYYLASAYSQSGGVDVFSLYSVMEIQLFHKNALEWSDLSKEKNPYLKFMKSQEGIDYEKKQKKKEAQWEKYEPKLITKYKLKPELTLQALLDSLPETPFPENRDGLSEYKQSDFDRDVGVFRAEYEKLLKNDELDTDAKIESLFKFTHSFREAHRKPTDDYTAMNAPYFIESYFSDRIFLNELKNKYLYPDQSNMLSDIKWEMLYMNILWNTYEAIPVMKKLPTLSSPQQADLSRSLEHYRKLLKSEEFKDVAIKNILVLSSVSLLSIYKESFDLNDVESIPDLYCSFDPTAIMNNYELIRERIFFLHQAYKDADIEVKDYEKYEAAIEQMKRDIPETLTAEEKDRFVEGIDEFKVNSCFNG
jgi:hypothetical protein